MTNIEEAIANMSPEQLEQETQNYKAKLDSVGEKYHHNAKLANLVKLWKEYEAAEEEKAAAPMKAAQTIAQKRSAMRQEHMKLIRVRITNHNPAKKSIQGEIFVTGNSILGDVRVVVPYNCDAAEAFHLPKIAYEVLKERKYTQRTIRTIQGKPSVTEKDVNEFSFEILPQLTEQELRELARKQAMANGVEVD